VKVEGVVEFRRFITCDIVKICSSLFDDSLTTVEEPFYLFLTLSFVKESYIFLSLLVLQESAKTI